MKKSIMKTGILLLLSAAFFSCSFEKYEPEITTTTTVKPVPVVFVNWQPDASGDVRFSVNDPKLILKNGVSFWKWGSYTATQFDEYTFETYKVSGRDGYGYGAIFSIQDDTNPSDATNDYGWNFLTVMIDVKGEYLIGKVINKKLKYPLIQGWKENSNISKGYNVKNKVSIKYLGSSQFRLNFNDQTTDEVIFQYNQEDGEPLFTLNGRCGYIVTLAPDENFPAVPVNTGFDAIVPVDIGLPVISPSILSSISGGGGECSGTLTQ
jgi:hypothetical protein